MPGSDDDRRRTLFDVMDEVPGQGTAAHDGDDDVARYAIGEEVARGGLGRILRAHDRRLDREVAYKTMLRHSGSATARFEREMRLTARLQHPNIVPVHDGGRGPDDEPFMAMRLVHGRALEDVIDERTTLQERLELLPQVVDVCNAVAYAHSQHIVHRDLKPDNVLVGAFGETVVIDWGLAKDLDADELEPDPTAEEGPVGSGSLTRVGSVVGTPAYMPPEQAAGADVDARADVYALGAVLYHVLAGRRPYDSAADTLDRTETTSVNLVGWLGPDPLVVASDLTMRRGRPLTLMPPLLDENPLILTGEDPLALCEADGDVHLLWPDGRVVTLDDHRSWPDRLAVHPDHPAIPMLASAGWGHQTWLWDLGHPDVPGRLLQHTEAVRGLWWIPGTPDLLTGSIRGVVRRWHQPLDRDPDRLRRQIHHLADELEAGRQVPTATELRAVE